MDCARNIITANFSGGGTSATTAPLWQWDYGQVLCITGIEDLPAAFEVHFSTNRTGGVSTTAVGADGQVTIPNVLLTIGKNLNAWIYLSDAQGEGETEYSITIPVKARPMPEYYDVEATGEFDDVVRQVSEYAETAQTAADNAGASATAAAGSASAAAASASSAAGSAGAAEQARANAVTAKGQAETAAQTATEKALQTAQNASQAALDAGRAESAAERAESAEAGAGAAKTAAEAAAQSAAASAATADEKATLAGQSATAAAGSASAAAQSAASIEGDVQIASQKASEAQTAAGQAVTAKDAAVTAQTAAETAATNAGQSASTATTKAAEAATSASNAAQSKTDAEAAAARAEQAAASLTVDTALSDSSTNPVQNKVITGELTDVKSAINQVVSTTEETAIDGFSESNTSTTNNGTAPFVFWLIQYDFSGCYVSSVKLKGVTAGVVSLGTIKIADATGGATANRTKATIKATINIGVGVQTVEVSSPFTVASDEYLFIGFPGDTGKWTYGSNGVNKYFYYVNGSGNWAVSPNSVGVTVYTKKYELLNVRNAISSVYTGKKLSILGDSISTFSGYIPEGNATYYPSGTVTSVEDTWWYKLYTALGMTLDTNNSWSGSRVTTTGGEASAGCMTRCQSLGSPDVIIVWMGINDFNNEVQLGTYDGTSTLPSATTTFREAYAVMLNKILTAYQSAEVWVCTLPQCERNAETGFPELNGNGDSISAYNKAIRELADAFGVRVLEHNKSGLTYQNMPVYNPDNLHPNKYGHSLVANNDIWQMDGTVARRYPIS